MRTSMDWLEHRFSPKISTDGCGCVAGAAAGDVWSSDSDSTSVEGCGTIELRSGSGMGGVEEHEKEVCSQGDPEPLAASFRAFSWR